jgi:hypothetical protein
LKQFWSWLNVNGTVLLPSMFTVPTPDPSVWEKSGTMPVAFVLLWTFAVVSCDVKINELGSDHLTFVDVPLNAVPVSLTSAVPGHPDVGETDVRCHADAAWALPRNTNSPSVLAMRLIRLENRRARGSALVPCMGSLRKCATSAGRAALDILPYPFVAYDVSLRHISIRPSRRTPMQAYLNLAFQSRGDRQESVRG